MPRRRVPLRTAAAVLLATLALAAGGCSRLAWKAADQAAGFETLVRTVEDIEAPAGFRAVLVAEGFTYPSALTWDGAGTLYVLESHTVPIPGLAPRVLRVSGDGEIEEVPLSGPRAPGGDIAVGLTFHDGWLYLSHEEEGGTFGVYRLRPPRGDGEPGPVEAVVTGLPTRGDHDVNYLAFDAAGDLWFGLGSATNSGVVASHDPVNQKWIEKHPEAHDVPCRDLVLTGRRFADANALTAEEGDRAVTGAFQPYGEAGAQRVAGRVPCSGALFRVRLGTGRPDADPRPELVAWGFRNPVALAFDRQGRLHVGMHGADVRGTRPVANDPDAVYRVREGAWYGWPDYAADLRPVSEPEYRPPRRYLAEGHVGLEPVIDHAASGLEAPDPSLLVYATEPHAALGGMTFLPDTGPFARWAGHLLLSEMGDFRPQTDPVDPAERAGFQVERVDPATGRAASFLRNRGSGDPQPASALDLEDGLERPVDVRVGPDGLVYVLDFGVFTTTEQPKVLPKTGKVFRVEPVGGPAEGR
ncbi:MAG TPA: hypothetical protein VHQ65_01670 [Thermoanaerobaculia bacterium]|nr:hypothetical protein [Thermoanaerobaculia bacterium]